MEQLLNRLKAILKDEDIIMDGDMSQHTSFKAGGKAALLLVPQCKEELMDVLSALKEYQTPHLILGNGTNTLFKDKGYSGAVVKMGKGFDSIEVTGETVTAGASVLMSSLGKAALENSLTGFEFASGIPGSIGGGVFMNAGAYGGELKDVLVSAHVISGDGSKEREVPVEALDLAYRHSILEETGEIVVSATFKLKKGDKDTIQETMRDLTQKRNSKQPVQYPSGGSFFKRPEGYFAGKLIQDAGLKGLTVGGAQVSVLHSGFIINVGGATETDISQLMRLVQNTVKDKFDVDLEPEVRIVGD